MMEARDMDISSGVNRVSAEDVLSESFRLPWHMLCGGQNAPHSNEILHHELVESLRRMRHVYFTLAVAEVGLLTRESCNMI